MALGNTQEMTALPRLLPIIQHHRVGLKWTLGELRLWKYE